MSNLSARQLKDWAIEAAPIGVVVTDATADDNPIVYANERFLDLTGYQEREVLGRNCRFLQGPGTDPEPVSALRGAVEEGRSTSVELRNYRKDGTCFWNAVSISPIEDDHGNVTHFVGYQRDVTDRVENERELRRRKERFEQFANIISHDLKNPLNVLGVSLEMAEETGDHEHFAKSGRMIDRMNSMIEDLLILARQGQAVGTISPVELSPAVDACWDLIETEDASLVNAARSTILADDDRLSQLLQNLLLNAVEHGGTDVTVAVGDLLDGFYVEDDGPGIPPGKRELAFEPGYTTSRDGTGFGLQIVEQIADAHGWAVALSEGPDGGARFEITGVEFL